MLTPSFLRCVEDLLGKRLQKKIHIRRVQPISGGSINQTAKLDTTAGNFFLKANDAFQFPKMFEKEAKGLKALKETNIFTIPESILADEADGMSFLILQFIESKLMSNDFWEKFGTGLARLHKITSPKFGLEEDNYIGSLVQHNQQRGRWIDFFVEERLEKQLLLAMRSGKMNSEDQNNFKRLYMKLETLLPEEPPALLHGDLWNGNFITDSNGEPCLIDPAVYFGHREVDLAMTKLFGGFDEKFYNSYHEEFPLNPGFEERIELHNLYPLMVHVNLFGGQYVSSVRGILKRSLQRQ